MIDRISMPSLFLATTLVQVIAALLTLGVLRMFGREPAVRWWSASYIMYAASALTYTFSGGKTTLLVIALGNTFALLAAAFLYTGIAIVMRLKVQVRLVAAILISSLIGISIFALLFESLSLRNLFYTLATNILYIMAIHCLLLSRRHERGFLHYVISLSLALFIVTLSARAIDLLFTDSSAPLFRNSFIQVSWMIGIQVTTFITAFGFLLLISSRMAHKLKHLGSYDQLTGALNRTQFENSATSKLSDDPHKTYCLLVFDIDNFKLINDQYGHEAGDLALERMSALVEKYSPDEAIFGRAGGDEFWLIVEPGAESASDFANTLCLAIGSTKISTEKNTFQISTSIGLCEFKGAQFLEDSAGIYSAADLALYQAKSNGRNCCRVSTYQQKSNMDLSPV